MKNISLIAFLLFTSTLFGQQEGQFTQYNDNMLYYNPAYAGSNDNLNLTAIHRQQWVGIDGAPMTQSFAAHSPLKYESVGLGISFINDRVGPMNSTWINMDASYSLRFKKHKGRLSFGIKGGVNMLNARLTQLYTTQQNDASLSSDLRNQTLLNLGAGVYYHSKHWFAGVSIPRIVENNPSAGNMYFKDQRHYYATIGGYFNVNRMLKIRPSAMYKMTANAPFALDGSLYFIIYDKVWLGANYRLKESGAFVFQYQISNQFKFGYACEIATSPLIKHNYGTHEIMLSYDFNFKGKSITSPRFF